MRGSDWIKQADDTIFRVFNFIDGTRLPCRAGDMIEKLASRNGAPLYELGVGEASAVDAAVASAASAYAEGRWRKKPFQERKNILEQFASLIETHREEFALYESMDVGKPIANAYFGDVSQAAGAIRDASQAGDKLVNASGLDCGAFSYQLRKPIGVAAAIVGWNFPLVLACQKVGPALIMGNSLVLKPSEFTSLSACRLAELAIEAGLPPGVLNVVNGSGGIVGNALAKHPDVSVLSFTGSSATGKKIMVSAGETNMKRLVLECGGKSPYLIFDDYEGDLDELAADVVATSFPNQGALCVSSTRILLQSGIHEQLLPRIIEKTKEIVPADPLLPDTSFGAIIHKQHLAKVQSYVQSGLDDGADHLCGGARVLEEAGWILFDPRRIW